MKILYGLLLGLLGVSVGLAAAFLSDDTSTILQETANIQDTLTYKVITNGG